MALLLLVITVAILIMVQVISISRIKTKQKKVVEDSYKPSMICMVYEYPRTDFKDSVNFLTFILYIKPGIC